MGISDRISNTGNTLYGINNLAPSYSSLENVHTTNTTQAEKYINIYTYDITPS